jgi:hypothetical protein
MAQKKGCYFYHLWEKWDYAVIFILNSHLGLSKSLRLNDNRPLNFEAATSKFGNHSWKFGCSPRKGKVDPVWHNGSKFSKTLFWLWMDFSCWNVFYWSKNNIVQYVNYFTLQTKSIKNSLHPVTTKFYQWQWMFCQISVIPCFALGSFCSQGGKHM